MQWFVGLDPFGPKPFDQKLEMVLAAQVRHGTARTRRAVGVDDEIGFTSGQQLAKFLQHLRIHSDDASRFIRLQLENIGGFDLNLVFLPVNRGTYQSVDLGAPQASDQSN